MMCGFQALRSQAATTADVIVVSVIAGAVYSVTALTEHLQALMGGTLNLTIQLC